MRRGLAIALMALLGLGLAAPGARVADALPLLASPREPVIGVAVGDAEDPGTLTPTGNGAFAIDDRSFVGRILTRSVSDGVAACLTGQFRTDEDWSLEAPRLSGSHESALTIRSDHGNVVLRLRGRMEFPTASGSWTVVRSSGGCADLEGEGSYTATFPTSSESSRFHLTFDGQART
jgi:hypothetical protein